MRLRLGTTDLECAGSILHSQDHTKASLRRSVRNNRQKSTLRTSKRAERLRKISVPYNKFSVLDLYNYKVFKCAKVKRQANSVTEMSTTRFTVLRTTNKSLLCEDSADKRYGSTEVDHSYGVTYKSPSPNGQSSHDIHPKLKGDSMDPQSIEAGGAGAGDGGNLTSYERNLYLYHEECPDRPRVATLLSSLADYDAVIPANPGEDPPPAAKKANLGTIAGVYFPCIQNIFGVIFFIRLVWIVGTAGVPVAFVVVFLCCSVTFTTCISLSAIATNGIVPAGGSYFMISRSLGPEFGGAVGILFYLATTVAAAMYVTGAVEIFLNYLCPEFGLYGDFRADSQVMYNNFRTYGTVLLIIMTFIVWIGVAFVSKLAPIALFCVLASILSVFVGAFVNFDGKTDLLYCKLGDRILSQNVKEFNCTKESEALRSLFCLTNNTRTYCDPYYESHDVQEVISVPGISSGVFFDNLPINFREKGQVVSTNPDDDEHLEETKKRAFIVSDITTTFTFFVAIFFPSVTGIMAGSNRSGDLADAQKSIPTGTLAAQITTSIVYLAGVFLFSAAFDNAFLRDKFGDSVKGQLAVAQLAYPHPMIVVVGSLLSTIGAGLQSLTGAPRLLQAIAKDGVIPVLNPMALSSSRGEPVRALLLTAFISELGILIGNLDHIAPILTMFFLMCYMFVNLACTLQSLLRTPNWRPRFRYYHWSLSLIGALLCLVVMFLSSWYYALMAMAIAGIVYKYIEYRGAEKEWGDGLRGLALSAARFSLLRLEEGPPHTKNWRPQVLVLCKLNNDYLPKHRKMITFASQLKAGKGLTIVASVLEGDYQKMAAEAQASKLSLKRVLQEERVKGFAEVVVGSSVVSSIGHLIQTSGLGGLKHNTVVLGWPYGWRQSPDDHAWRVFIETIRNVSASKNALLVPKNIQQFPSNTERVRGTIDVWWIVHDGGLLMLLPFLLKQHKVWKNCKLRIFTVAQLEDNSIQMKKDLATFLYHLRIDAEVEVVEMTGSDISAYTYERTLMMEQRSEMLKHLRLNRRETLSMVQTIMDHHHHGSGGQNHTSRVRFNENADGYELVDVQSLQISGGGSAAGSRRSSAHSQTAVDGTPISQAGKDKSPAAASPAQSATPAQAASPSSDAGPNTSPEGFDNLLKIKPDEANVRRMHTAVKLNEVIVAKSHDSQLVIINLPGPPRIAKGEENYMEFLEVLTEGLERVLMVRGGGREVITIYS
ncbi:solute carrier family 12 member 4-like isoform X3 [Varroa destructor]|uniref:Solute carrier family 12 member 6 n=1 Tax=Varroa destructor TaxID=109461 RepID=A0A7M7KTG4_VARDE|nr:solute carrier family 12 member 4-like isoform X3 [Varroa destructor]